MTSDVVSVCITTYNRKQLLPLALQSVLRQSYRNIEVIIVDDCSTDGTEELVKSRLLKLDDRVRYLKHSKNMGLAAGRNTAIQEAKGKYFTFCDDDDEWDENFVAEFVKMAARYDENWCFCCGNTYINLLGAKIHMIPSYEGGLKSYLKAGFTPPVASQFYRLSSLNRVRGYNEKIESGVDHDLWIRLARDGVNIKCIDKALSLPNANSDQDRMTTNYERRINGISSSLIEWKDDLVALYGEEFYKIFCKAYLRREFNKFLNRYLQDFNISMAFKVKKDMSVLMFLKIAFVVVVKKVAVALIPKAIARSTKSVSAKPVIILESTNK